MAFDPTSLVAGLSDDQKKQLVASLFGTAASDILKSIPLDKTKQMGAAIEDASSALIRFNGVSSEVNKTLSETIGLFSDKFGSALKSLISKVEGQIKKYQELNQEFIKLGRGEDSRQYIESIRQQSFESRKLGISLTELITINKDLLKNYTGASLIVQRQTEEFKNNQQQITELIGFNTKFGVTQEQTTQILNLFNIALDGGSKGAQKLSDNLIIFSQRAGISTNKIFSEFNENLNRFYTMSADRAVESFTKLELAASRTGTSVKSVLQAVQKFDDIDEGFQAGGQLNRVLSFMGGSFDTFKAMQATDEERATMLYQAIAQTGDRFQQLQTEQAKRAMVSQIEKASGLDTRTIVGLLNKSTNLAEDIAQLSSRELKAEEFTAEGRERTAMEATTSEQLGNVQSALLDLNPIIVKLSNQMQLNTQAFTQEFGRFTKNVDESLKLGAKNSENANSLVEVVKGYVDQIKPLASKFEKEAKEFDRKKEQTQGILEGATTTNLLQTTMSDVKKSMDKLNERAVEKIKVEVQVTAPDNLQTKVTTKTKTAADTSEVTN